MRFIDDPTQGCRVMTFEWRQGPIARRPHHAGDCLKMIGQLIYKLAGGSQAQIDGIRGDFIEKPDWGTTVSGNLEDAIASSLVGRDCDPSAVG